MCAPAIAMKSVFSAEYWDISQTASYQDVRQKYEFLKHQYFMLQKEWDESPERPPWRRRQFIRAALRQRPFTLNQQEPASRHLRGTY